MQEIVYHKNYELENSYWWFIARNQIVYDVFKKLCPIKSGSDVLDVGCGTGGFASKLVDEFNVIGIDTSDIALDYSKKRGIKNLYNCYLEQFPKEKYDVKAITILDVIEHIENDKAVVEQCFDLLPKNGYMIATVPAYSWLWSEHDVMHMHYRRYNQQNFNKLLTDAGFSIKYSTYFNTMLFLPAVLKRFTEKLLNKNEKTSPIDEVPEVLNTIFKNLFLFENNFLPTISFPFGISLLTVAQKP